MFGDTTKRSATIRDLSANLLLRGGEGIHFEREAFSPDEGRRQLKRHVIKLKDHSSPYMRNKRHIGNATTIRMTPNLCFSDKHGTSVTGLKCDGRDYWLCGIIGYESGFLEYEARLLDNEAREIDRLFQDVAERVHTMAIRDDLRRRRDYP